MKKPIIALLLLWFVAVFAAAYAGVFISEPGRLTPAVALAFAVPLLAFFVAFASSTRFRNYVSDLPTVPLVALHGWRFIGLGFIMAYYYGLLSRPASSRRCLASRSPKRERGQVS